MIKSWKWLSLIALGLLASCETEEINRVEIVDTIEKEVEVIREVEVEADQKFENGFFVTAEGNFGAKDGSISYVQNDFSGVANFAYNKINDAQLGGLIQSVAFGNDKIYAILNDANTIVVINKITLKQEAIITTGLGNPRYMTIVGGKGYITNWGDGADTTDDYIAVLDLNSNKIDEASKISLENGVEQIVNKNNKLYVSHKGAFSTANIVSVVDLSDTSVSTITVKDNPDELFFADNGQLVVLSEGNPTEFGGAPFFEVLKRTTSAIQFINIDTETVEKEIEFAENVGAGLMAYENGNIFYNVGDEVFSIEDSATTLSSESGISVGNIYGMNVKEGKLYTLNFAFTSFSDLNIIDVETGATEFSTAVGLGASKVYFQ